MVLSRNTGTTRATSVLVNWLHAVLMLETAARVLIGWISAEYRLQGTTSQERVELKTEKPLTARSSPKSR